MNSDNNERQEISNSNQRQRGRGYPRRYPKNNRRNNQENKNNVGEQRNENFERAQPPRNNNNRPYRGQNNGNYRPYHRYRKSNNKDSELNEVQQDTEENNVPVTKRYNNKRKKSNKTKRQTVEIESQRENLIDSLMKGNYECMVCLKELNKRDQIWSCSACYHIFHLRCIKKWSKSNDEGLFKMERYKN